MNLEERFEKLLNLTQELSDIVDRLTDKVLALEEIARYQESQMDDLRYSIKGSASL